MIPQEELDRALARWKARINGHELPAPVLPVVVEVRAHAPVAAAAVADEATQVVASPYQGGESGNVVAEVNLSDGDFEDFTHKSAS